MFPTRQLFRLTNNVLVTMSKPYHASRDNVRHKYVMSREPRRKCIIVGFFAAMMYGD